MKTFEKYLFLTVFILSFLGIIGIVPKANSVILWIAACIYLIFGWMLLDKEFKMGFKVVPFLISFLIAETIVTIIFGINRYPLKNEFVYITVLFLLSSIILIILNRKKLAANFPIDTYLFKLIVCFVFSFTPLWSEILAMNK